MIHDRSNLDVAYGGHIHDNLTYNQVKAWSRQAVSYHLSRCEPTFMTPHDMMLPVLNELIFVNNVGRTSAHLYTLANIHTQHDGRYVIYSCKSVTPTFLPQQGSPVCSNPYRPGGLVCPLNEPGKWHVVLLVHINLFAAYLERFVNKLSIPR